MRGVGSRRGPMKASQNQDPPTWLHNLMTFESADGTVAEDSRQFTSARGRTILVAQARWLLLLVFALYGLAAAVTFASSRYGLFVDTAQIVTLLVAVVTVFGYNTLCHFYYPVISRLRYVDHLQILFDLILVTLLVHYSGGAASWFWPVYLVVSIEAAVLLERRRQVLAMGSLGSLLYGGLLLAEYHGWVASVAMPFVDPILHSDGLYLGLSWFWVCVLNATVALISAFLMRIIRRENQAHRESEQRLVSFLDTANDLIFCVREDGSFIYTNRSWQQTLGYDNESLPQLKLQDIVQQDDKSRCIAAFNNLLDGNSGGAIEGRMAARDGRAVNVEGSMTCSRQEDGERLVWGICRDITERKRAQDQLYHLAHHDALTGLPNRTNFIERLQQELAMAKRIGREVAVLFLDLDRFKMINDTLGHDSGDALLVEVAARLKKLLRETDAVGRLGGDEFAIVLGNLNCSADAERVAEKILKILAEPLQVNEHELFITTSIGVSHFPAHHNSPEELVKKADIAMYSAKAQGRNNFKVYNRAMDFDSERRMILETGIRRALERDEFRIHYQPKVDASTGEVTSLEALLRWQHPDLGLLPPADFISLAEETGLIFSIGEWVLRRVCHQVREWADLGLGDVRVAVNLSGYQLQQQNLVGQISQALEDAGVSPECLELEVTETVVMQNPDFAVAILRQLKELGICISIDDFGTGYSSLSHLRRFSINTLKIDKSFVQEVERNATDAAITQAIIAMGKSLDLKIVAEGVETEGQLEFLRGHDCHEIQGYLFSQPVAVDKVTEILRNGLDLKSLRAAT
ncbi:GGDEF domain-containing protein [Geothermobacter hydrogeniphilus]|uniref:GGDEF domain-containing protein n=2 Tax=Geothermobacter hydrogeniphilus TaxID=1969733 RepID=A0A2K2H664_9BACT|nr:GGDEF domain-containing protein [Geothermobacter hydrogeniphilus]